MIRMKSGVYGGKKLIRREDGPFSLPAQEEARLVERGVAEYVGESAQPADAPVKPMEDMTLAELRAMGKEYGLTFKVGMTKAAMVEAIKAEIEKEQEQASEEPEDIEDDTEDVEDAPTFDPAEAVQ